MRCRGGEHATVRAWYKPIFGGAIQRVTREDTGAGGGTRRHVFWTNGLTLMNVAHSYTRVFNVRATRQAGNFYCGPRGSISELKPTCVTLVHHFVRNL